jgi:lipopolysaccharide/colanic/teichoic acid biosynthesis glycosyltransferase
MKRLFDFVASLFGLIIASPILVSVTFFVWLTDRSTPFYVAPRVGKDKKIFQMVKLRSMVVNADKTGVDSTSANDSRITPIGHFIRRYKLDELSQLWNVFKGEMSLVGPRPNLKRETDLYTDIEKKMLSVKPGITDPASIVFSDLGEILKSYPDPDLTYNQRVRPWKSRLSLAYIDKQSFFRDLQLIFITILAIFSRELALKTINKFLLNIGTDEQLLRVALRQEELSPFPPPGATEIVLSREC